MSRTRVPGDGPRCWCGAPATFSGFCNGHYNTDTGVKILPPSPRRSLGWCKRIATDFLGTLPAYTPTHLQLEEAIQKLAKALEGN